MFSVEECRKVPVERKKVIEDAVSNLGLSIDELREKLLVMAEKQAEQVEIEEIDQNTNTQPEAVVANMDDGIATLSQVRMSAGGASQSPNEVSPMALRDQTKFELEQWKRKAFPGSPWGH